MSSMFEGPSQPSRIFSAPPPRRLFWPKVIGAFAAGVVCTILISRIPSDSSPVPPPVQSSKLSRVEAAKQRAETRKTAQRAESKAPARTEAAPNDARPSELAGAATPSESRPAESSAVPQSESTASAPAAASPAAPSTADVARQADALNCDEQTWPYVDQKCNTGATQTTRPVRVIPTDRSAPSSVVTAAPSRAPAAGSNAPAASTNANAEGSRSATGSAPADEPRQFNRKERAEVRPAPVNTVTPSRETVGHAAAADPVESARDTPPATKSAGDRRQRRNALRRESRKNAASETRRSRENTLNARNRTADEDDDEERYVREFRLSDGRRVIIQRRTADDHDASGRRVIVQRRTADSDDEVERLGLRMPPFFFNPLTIGN